MPQRILAFLLFGVLALAAFDGFETRREQREENALATPSGISSEVTVMDGGNPYPPVKKY